MSPSCLKNIFPVSLALSRVMMRSLTLPSPVLSTRNTCWCGALVASTDSTASWARGTRLSLRLASTKLVTARIIIADSSRITASPDTSTSPSCGDCCSCSETSPSISEFRADSNSRSAKLSTLCDCPVRSKERPRLGASETAGALENIFEIFIF